MRLEPESIPFPFSRLYLLAVARSKFFRTLYATVAEEVSAQLREGVVLDAACGPGDLAIKLAGLRPGLKIWGVDLSRDMVRLAARQAAASPHGARLRFERADVARLPFAEAAFDAAVSTVSLHHWRRPGQALAELHRVLKPYGFVLLCDFDRDMPAAAISAAVHRYGSKMYFLYATRLIEPFYSAASLGRLLEASPFPRWRVEPRGVLLWARLEKEPQ
jgi:ubiquinone/menaquinone biosynthesis C-methylase UbiE